MVDFAMNGRHELSSTNSNEADSHMGGSQSAQSEDAQDIQTSLMIKEEGVVRKAKCFVAMGVFLCAVAVLLSVYFLDAQSDQRSFELAVRTYNTVRTTTGSRHDGTKTSHMIVSTDVL